MSGEQVNQEQQQQQQGQEQDTKDFSEDVQVKEGESFEQQNGQVENGAGESEGGAGDAAGTDSNQESQEDRSDGKNQDSLNKRKLFVGGLSWETTDKELRDHFNQFGDIESINVKTDPNTGRSRGFAFIVFAKAESLDKAMAHGDHIINNKKVDPKKAKARHGKIFVGRLTSELSNDDIKNYFAQFGTIVEVEMPFDKTKNQRKGFCFITFESEQVANELLKTAKQTIMGKEVDVKKAAPRQEQMGGMRGMGGRGGRGSRGGRGRGFGNQSAWTSGYGSGYGQAYGSNYATGYDGYPSGYDYYGGYGSYGDFYEGYGYGSSYDGGYGSSRGGARGKGSSGFGGKQRGGNRQNQRHQPY